MIDFTVNEQMAGSAIELSDESKVKVEARVRSVQPVNRVEVVSNGKVVYEASIDEPSDDVMIETEVSVNRSGWIAVRAAGDANADQPTGRLFAHTSPVYVDVKARPVDAKADAAYFVTWADRLYADIRRRNRVPSRHVNHIQSQIGEARAIFVQLAEGGN